MPPDAGTDQGAVAATLGQFRSSCGWTCPTCGGYAGTVQRLRDLHRRGRSAYLTELAAFHAGDFVEIGATAPLARAALDVVGNPIDRARVLDSWADTVRASSEVALVALHMAGPHLPLSRRLMREMIALAEARSILAQHLGVALGPLALEHRMLWSHAKVALQQGMNALTGWEEFEARAEHERALERARWEREWARRAQVRADEVARLCNLSVEERLRALAAEVKRFDHLEGELAQAPGEEVQSLLPEFALAMARSISASASEPWLDLKRRLLAVHSAEQKIQQQRRAQSRRAELAGVAAYAPLERLVHITREERRRLDYWPIEWAAVDDGIVAELDPVVRSCLAERIRRQARRLPSPADRETWRTLGRQLARSPGEPGTESAALNPTG